MKSVDVRFAKYHGLGNDFIVFAHGDFPTDTASIQAICDRHRGVGADGVIFFTIADAGATEDARMVIYNRDGSRPQMCGNGIRCLARHLVEQAELPGRELRILTDAGIRICRVDRQFQVSVDMGVPALKTDVPPLAFDAQAFPWTGVNMGNPHAVIFAKPPVPFIDAFGRWANASEDIFPEGVNVEFVETVGPGRLDVVVYERGVGRTQACGTGACAVAAAAWERGICERSEPVEVGLPGGALVLTLHEDHVWMTGSATRVFDGAFRTTSWLE